MADKLIDRKDILSDLVTQIAPKYFPENTLDNNRTSIFGYISEAMAKSIEDTIVLEQRRSADYCPELSDSAVHVRQTAKIRGVDISYAVPGRAFALIGILKDDIINKGTKLANEIRFTIDRRSTILHDGVHFSLEDDIIIRAVRRSKGYVYAASYSGEHSSYDSYIQMFEQTNDLGQEMITMIVQIHQFNYNIQEKCVTDIVEFLYDGISYDYDNKLAGFEVYYKQSANDVYKRLDLIHYLSTEATKAIYYNDDDDNILVILDNPALNIGINAMIRVEIKETLGKDGMVTIGDANTTFSIYRDSSYTYSGVNVMITMLSDTYDASDGDSLAETKAKLVDAKTRRNNITTEHDIISYINDIDANVQIVKKRNDIEDRRYYMYTLLRHNGEIVPATTKRLFLNGIVSPTQHGDFDRYDQTVGRKVLRAYNKFKLVRPTDPDEEEYAIKVSKTEPEQEGEFYYTCPFMILIDDKEMASYYFTSVNENVLLSMRSVNNLFPFQIVCREVTIARNSHDEKDYDKYTFIVKGTMNTSNDLEFVGEDGSVLDDEAIVCYIVIRKEGSPVAYLPMKIHSYDQATREFTFAGEITTTDYVTEKNLLEITRGLWKNGTNTNYNSVIDFKDAFFDVSFMCKYDDAAGDYTKTDSIYQVLPKERSDGYVLMCSYYNTPQHPYNLLLEFNKFSNSPVKTLYRTKTTVNYSIGEVPFIKYDYGIQHIVSMYDTFKNMSETYGSLLKLTTDFEVSLKFTSTYGRSKYITVTGGRVAGEETVVNLADLNPTLYFKVYGVGVDLDQIYQFIYEYLRDTYITGSTVFMSNICTLIEQKFPAVRSIKYMGVNDHDASYQEFVYTVPTFDSVDIVTRFVPEQLNVTNIELELDET